MRQKKAFFNITMAKEKNEKKVGTKLGTKQTEEEKQQQLQQHYIEMQMASQQINNIEAQIKKIDENLEQLNATTEALEDIKNTKQGTDILVPVGPGIFAAAKLDDNKNIKVNIGSKVTVEKSIDEAIKMINKQVKELINYKRELTDTLSFLTLQIEQMEESILKLSEE
ncbi:prefoldin subunit alpha [Candidatus Woesearchaeota archaeon]|mgnify:CR=1 FL=1|nr:MAG: prefoldin subunit alpha [Candidatus Woesearchaeota archaeon]